MGESFATSLGVTVEFMPIPPMLTDKIEAAYQPPAPPFYEIKTATGAVEKHIHDETTVQTDEEKATLAAYRAECERRVVEHNRAMTRLALLKGIAVDMPASEEWVREQEFLGVVVPTDPLERKLHWIETCVIGTEADLNAIVRGVGQASGATEAQLAQAEATFRRTVERARRNQTPRPKAKGRR